MALIHDDIIDKWEMRHNKQCFHKFASSLVNTPNKEHLWNAQAILAWDLIFARAYDILYSDYQLPSKQLSAAQKHMQLMIEEVISGQMLDVDTMTWDHLDIKKIEEKNHYKSWQYTFTRPLVTGALLAWVHQSTIKQLAKIWSLLGTAYQLRDDILDVKITDWDDTSHYDNKTKFSDIQDWQQTYLTQYIYEHGSYAHRLAISKAMWKRLSEMQINDLRHVFVDSWAIDYWMTIFKECIAKAKKLIEKLSVKETAYKEKLLDIIRLLEVL